MKKIMKYMIIVFLIIILLIVILLYLFKKNNNEININESESIDSNAYEVQVEEKVKKVESTELVFNIKKCIQNYIDYINDNNYDAVLEVLDKNYIESNKITKDDIKQTCKDYLKSCFIVNDIYQKDVTIMKKLYFVDVKLMDIDTYEDKGSSKFTIIIDEVNQTYAVIPEIINDDNYNYNFTIEYDDENYYNEYIYINYPEIEIFTEYFNYYKELAKKRPEDAFNLLDKEYKEKRFNNSLELYKEYLIDIDINNIYPDKISTNFKEDYKEYICIDKKGIYYIFTEISPMQFSVKLDTYTLISNKFKETYDSASDEEKVSININKWLEMIKNKDYYNAYNILDENFRNTNFGSVESFKNYIIQKYNDNFTNKVEGIKYYGDSLYSTSVNIKIVDQERKDIFIVKLQENRSFVLSFRV